MSRLLDLTRERVAVERMTQAPQPQATRPQATGLTTAQRRELLDMMVATVAVTRPITTRHSVRRY